MRQWIKHHLPYGLTCGIARLINRPFLEPESRCERLVEYTWVLNNMKPGRTLDFGYAGSYLAQALCFFGPVDGVDLRRTPPIRHENFSHYRDIPNGALYDNIVCVSVLEHIFCHNEPCCHCAADIVDSFYQHLAPGGQVLLTYPLGIGKRFKGYRELNVSILGISDNPKWRMECLGVGETALNTEHKTSLLALTRLTRPQPSQPPSWRSDPTLGSASG